jgi:segregation and condensation protein B
MDEITRTDNYIEISYPKLKNILESFLFIAKKPVTVEEIQKIIWVDPKLIEKSLYDLMVEYESHGINVVKIAGGYHMVTHSDNSAYVYDLLHSPIGTTLSNAALETLSIIAYKQPITKLAIENIRGVNSDGVVATLLEKKLIQEVGKADTVGRPVIYATTIDFLRHFGLKELTDLAPLPMDEIEAFKEGSILPKEQSENEDRPAAQDSTRIS